MPDVRPYPKAQQLARGERRYRRKVASAKTWQRIIDAKQGPSRVAGDGPIQWHHLVERDAPFFGDDCEDNIVPVAQDPHDRVTAREPAAVRELLASLTDAEYAYCIDKGGEDFFARAYSLEYQRP